MLAAERSPDSYIAGGIAINRNGPRFSGDIYIFQDTEQRLETAALADAKALIEAGLEFSWKKIAAGAAADRREPRDIVDFVTIHESILPLGAVICAAVGRFPGQSPEEMLADIIRHSRFTAEEFRVLATQGPIDIADLHRRIRSMIEDAEKFVCLIPSDVVGFLFLKEGIPDQPDLAALDKYQLHAGARGGVWPTSPEISTAMLERYKMQKPSGKAPQT